MYCLGHTLHAAASRSHHHWYHINKFWEGYGDIEYLSVLTDKKKKKKKTDSIFCMQVFGLDVSKIIFFYWIKKKWGGENNYIMILQKQIYHSNKRIIIILMIHLLATCYFWVILLLTLLYFIVTTVKYIRFLEMIFKKKVSQAIFVHTNKLCLAVGNPEINSVFKMLLKMLLCNFHLKIGAETECIYLNRTLLFIDLLTAYEPNIQLT